MSALDDDHPAPCESYTAAELMEKQFNFAWLAEGLISDKTCGVTGGLWKSLKSYVSMFCDVGIAAGVPVLGYFAVPEARPVRVFVGEGGQALYQRRLRRVCKALNVDPQDLQLHIQFEVRPVDTPEFRYWIAEDLEDIRPARTSFDPWYRFQGEVKSSDLYERGRMLGQFSQPYEEAGVSLNIVDHFRKSASGSGLDELAQAGMAEWADSWLLLSHREPPNVPEGKFKLLMEVGSRQWGGDEYEVDIDVGVFNKELKQHDGDIKFAVRPFSFSEAAGEREAKLLALLKEHPFEYNKTELYKRVKGNKPAFDWMFKRNKEDGTIAAKGGKWGLSGNH